MGVLYEADRLRIKNRSLPADVLQYIEVLEEIATKAFDVWKFTPHMSKPTGLTLDALSDLYDSLAKVNFMEEGDTAS